MIWKKKHLLVVTICFLTVFPLVFAILPFQELSAKNELVRVADYTMNEIDFSFGSWGRGIMLEGLLETYNITNDRKYEDFSRIWTDQCIWTQTTEGALGHGDVTLGDSASLAMSVLYFYQRTGSDFYRIAAQKELQYLLADAHRFHDQYRGISHTHDKLELWIDQLYMVGRFLAKYGVVFNDQSVINESINQTKSHMALLQDPATKLVGHIIRETAPGVYMWIDPSLWGRGIGWALVTIVDIMDLIKGMPQQVDNFNYLNQTLNELVVNISNTQDASGLWHTLVYNSNSYLETSCAALFAYGIAKAVNNSWIASSNASIAEKAFNAVLAKVNDFGVLRWVSGGTGASPESAPRSETAVSWGQGIFLKMYAYFKNNGWVA